MPTKQVMPGTLGGAFSVIYMIYGEWWGIVPKELGQTQELALTGAIAVLAAGVVNLIKYLLPKKETSDA